MQRVESVLIVEDHEDVRGLISRHLDEAGCTVVEAENGREALSMVKEHANVPASNNPKTNQRSSAAADRSGRPCREFEDPRA